MLELTTKPEYNALLSQIIQTVSGLLTERIRYI